MRIHLDNWQYDTAPTVLIIILVPTFLYFSYWLFITGTLGLIRMLHSKKWLTTTGTIRDTEILFKADRDSDSNTTNLTFIKRITYSYPVNDRSYTSNQTLPSDSLYMDLYKPLRLFPKEYGLPTVQINNPSRYDDKPIGTVITVYYHPSKPGRACLDNQFKPAILMPVLMGLIFGTGLTFLAFYMIRPLF